MTASNTKTTDKKVVAPVKSIHVVVYACTNCGEEVEELKLCKECNSPMKVIQVFEKFGEDADKYLSQLKKEGEWDADSVTPKKAHAVNDGGIDSDDLEELDIPIKGIADDPFEEEKVDVDDLTDIFPDDGQTAGVEPDVDFQKALSALDEEEEDVSKDLEDLGPDGLPEL
ncbi:MAG: hypothetical protein UT34_C0002G0273 [candidate division WS6 bacterium GW2011_GWF2_39_15]|uniref:Uncharacterized protein n=1 Tax=candidate division WS6 bacterium GW2011_GWF2_39_15 TaxID=1619100 RepID=A0A0G0MYX8_9BACT|nr:MAG: hypothetical protein UT34_C0002G0273 [candidate division WS6 bacterium GW2011_GWF2_39_15]